MAKKINLLRLKRKGEGQVGFGPDPVQLLACQSEDAQEQVRYHVLQVRKPVSLARPPIIL